jgi:hypothetical protein
MSFTEHKLSVTKPCLEAWSSMTDADSGKHCKSCDKLVTDFSILDDAEIRNFFLKSGGQPVCGRFKSNQLDRVKIYIPTYVFRKPIPYWKRFLVIFLICFGNNLYPFDIIVGSKTSLYAQTAAPKKGGKKTNTKNKKKKYTSNIKTEFKFDPSVEIMILGFTQMIPHPETIPIPDFLVTKNSLTITDSAEVKSALLVNTNNKEQKNTPANKPSENKADYVLPAGFKYRRRKKPLHKSTRLST